MPSAMTTSEPAFPLTSIPISPTATTSTHARRASLKVLNRNIDKVVLGDLLFRTWYYSPYPESVITGYDQTSNHAAIQPTGSEGGNRRHSQGTNTSLDGASKRITAEQSAAVIATPVSTTTKLPTAPCECLHVCPYCFRYTPKTAAYIQHLHRHNVTYNPHEDGASTQNSDRIAVDAPSQTSSEASEDSSTWPVPESAIKVYEYDGYTVWDIDGDREKLYCQNLSLFGKLFLEQKSVFFDTGGFHYFVLTHTPSPSQLLPQHQRRDSIKKSTSPVTNRSSTRKRTSSGASISQNPTIPSLALSSNSPVPTRVLGFFSKENLSWDANNLACILIFPPYQHRNLGQLLMAISYKLSGWEWEGSIIGGPEKPLSAMGRKSYLRFWSERVARYWMGQSADADGHIVFDSDDEAEHNPDTGADTGKPARRRKKKQVGPAREEMTVRQIGERTGMLAEDVAAALTEMGVLEVISPKKQKKRKSDGAEDMDRDELGHEQKHAMVVHRSRVLEWAAKKGVDLISPVREEGFLGEWALSDADDGSAGGSGSDGVGSSAVEIDESE